MSDGVRILHPTARNARVTVVERRPYPVPYTCQAPEFGGCGSVHIFKTHHLNIDEVGACIIAADLYEKIKPNLLALGFSILNVVEKPPPMTIGVGKPVPGRGSWGNIPIIRSGNEGA